MAKHDVENQVLNVPDKVRNNPDGLAAWIHEQACKIFQRDRAKSAGFAGGQSRFALPGTGVVFARPDENEAIPVIETRLTELAHGLSGNALAA